MHTARQYRPISVAFTLYLYLSGALVRAQAPMGTGAPGGMAPVVVNPMGSSDGIIAMNEQSGPVPDFIIGLVDSHFTAYLNSISPGGDIKAKKKQCLSENSITGIVKIVAPNVTALPCPFKTSCTSAVQMILYRGPYCNVSIMSAATLDNLSCLGGFAAVTYNDDGTWKTMNGTIDNVHRFNATRIGTDGFMALFNETCKANYTMPAKLAGPVTIGTGAVAKPDNSAAATKAAWSVLLLLIMLVALI